MGKVTDWIKQHQLSAFFGITFAITGGLGFSYDAVTNRGNELLIPLAVIATCGPALAGILVTAVINTQPRQGSRRIFWIAFFAAWAVSTLVFLANNIYINEAPFSAGMVVFIFVAVAPVAFVISMAFSRIPSVKRYVSSLLRLHSIWRWNLMALALIPILILISIRISNLLGRHAYIAHRFTATNLGLIGLVVVKFLYQFFFFNATGEEIGWRGFALPRMQSIISPLAACLVINFFWPLWHFFIWKAEGSSVFSMDYWIQKYLELLPATVTINWLYNRSKGSILTAGLAHAAANTAFAFFPNLDWQVYNWTTAAAALVMMLVDRMWKKLPPGHPAVYKPAEPAAEPDTELTPSVST
ncbi:MAG: CPBP family intramembrane metalloprotease [Anaerolineales bacterium]|nr:CPBP family intramembrane metalloprotease [Anaerolineales bacterium]